MVAWEKGGVEAYSDNYDYGSGIDSNRLEAPLPLQPFSSLSTFV